MSQTNIRPDVLVIGVTGTTGSAVARSLASRGTPYRGTLTLTGPEALTHSQMTDMLADASGRTIQFADVSPDQFRESLAGRVPDWQVDGLIEDYAHYQAGEAAVVSDDIVRVLGKPARDFALFAREVATQLQP